MTLRSSQAVDAEVATTVMGLRHWPRFEGDVAGYWCAGPHPTGGLPCNLCVIDEALPAYSTDATAALDALTQVGGPVRIERWKPDEWHVRICGETRWAETLPLAICVTLLAVSTPKVAEDPGQVATCDPAFYPGLVE